MPEVARRTFSTSDGREVSLVIHGPAANDEDEWRAAVEFVGLDEETTEAVGIDSLQAYALALRMAEARLAVMGRRYGLRWESGADLVGDLML